MGSYSLTLITGPTVEPLTPAEAKLHARIDLTAEDALIDDLITTAREMVEARGLAIYTQTWELALDGFPSTIIVPKAPLQSVTSITYVDGDGTTQTLNASLYQVDTRSTPPRILPAYGTNWPTTRSVPNAVVVKFVAGYPPESTAIPQLERIRQYLRAAVLAMYEREPIPPEIEHLLDPFRLYV